MQLTFKTLKYLSYWPPFVEYRGFKVGDIVECGCLEKCEIIAFDIMLAIVIYYNVRYEFPINEIKLIYRLSTPTESEKQTQATQGPND